MYQPERTSQCYGAPVRATTVRREMMIDVAARRVHEATRPADTVAAVSSRLDITGVTKTFGANGRRGNTAVDALTDVSLTVEPGQTVTLLGPSGCGKTTLLRMIAGLEPPTSGTVTIDGERVDRQRRSKQIGFVPQSPALLPWRSVEANARLLLDINPTGSPTTTTMSVTELLDDVGLGDFADAYPHELSGGMQQRVGLVRAFALDAPLLLLDEPFAALDEITRTEMRHLLGRLRARLGTTVVFVTHSIAEAAFLSDRVAVMTRRPGRISELIDIELERPRAPEVEDTAAFFAITSQLRHALHAGGVL
jgi:NitT/TauT family transport system ATP-binding protein